MAPLRLTCRAAAGTARPRATLRAASRPLGAAAPAVLRGRRALTRTRASRKADLPEGVSSLGEGNPFDDEPSAEKGGPEPRQRGRPRGSPDKQPRQRRQSAGAEGGIVPEAPGAGPAEGGAPRPQEGAVPEAPAAAPAPGGGAGGAEEGGAQEGGAHAAAAAEGRREEGAASDYEDMMAAFSGECTGIQHDPGHWSREEWLESMDGMVGNYEHEDDITRALREMRGVKERRARVAAMASASGARGPGSGRPEAAAGEEGWGSDGGEGAEVGDVE